MIVPTRLQSIHWRSLTKPFSTKILEPSQLDLNDASIKARFQAGIAQSPSVRHHNLFSHVANSKNYAVLVPLLDVEGKASVLFTVRSSSLKDHKGEVSFPGGAVEAGESYLDAALRETYEEIGLQRENVNVWGEMQPSPTRNMKNLVYPFVGVIDKSVLIYQLTPHEPEVAAVFTKTVDHLVTPGNFGYTQFRVYGSLNGYSLPYFEGPPRIWGLSAIILHQVLKVLVADKYSGNLKYSKPVK